MAETLGGTPFDEPRTFLERLTFPALRRAWLDGYALADAHNVDLAVLGADAHNVDLAVLGVDEAQHPELIATALDLAKLGITPDQLPEILRFWFRGQTLGIDTPDLMHYAHAMRAARTETDKT